MKFYVWCGDINYLVDAKSEIEAAVKAVNAYADVDPSSGMKIAPAFVVNEKGFQSASLGDGKLFPLEEVLRQAGFDM
mgnify:FL=1